MKKTKFKIAILVIIIMGIIVYLIIPKEQKEQQEQVINAISKYDVNMEQSEGKNIKASTQNGMKLITSSNYNFSDKGYYYEYFGSEGMNIKFFDYNSKKEIFLCNKPNCNHDTESCNSFMDFSSEPSIFAYNNNLYTILSSVEKVSSNSSNTSMISSNEQKKATSIYRMNLDGTNKTKIFDCPSGVKLNTPFIIDDNTLYAFFTKSKTVAISGNKTSTIETERKLVKIDLINGKYTEIFDGKNKDILGIYNNCIIWSEIIYKEDPEKYLKDDTASTENIRNSTLKIKLLDLATLKENEIESDTYKNMQMIVCNGEYIYYSGSNSKEIKYINVSNKEKGRLIELPEADPEITGIYDNKLQYTYPTSDGKIKSAYYVDLITKENKQFTLKDSNGYMVEILANNCKDYYFVKKGYKMSKAHTTWAGTTQIDIEETYYALIKKDDYWNSKANYLNMTNTGK